MANAPGSGPLPQTRREYGPTTRHRVRRPLSSPTENTRTPRLALPSLHRSGFYLRPYRALSLGFTSTPSICFWAPYGEFSIIGKQELPDSNFALRVFSLAFAALFAAACAGNKGPHCPYRSKDDAASLFPSRPGPARRRDRTPAWPAVGQVTGPIGN